MRIQKCRQSFYSLSEVGMSFPGLDTQTKTYLWNSMCLPSLLYGNECITLSDCDIARLQSTQGCLIKQCLGLGKRSRHSHLLNALNVHKVSDVIYKHCLSLYHRIFQCDSPCRDFNIEMLSRYVMCQQVTPGTLLHRIVQLGKSPTSIIFNKKTVHVPNHDELDNGIVDSMSYLLRHNNFMKPYSEEHVLLSLLTKAF